MQSRLYNRLKSSALLLFWVVLLNRKSPTKNRTFLPKTIAKQFLLFNY